MEKHKIIIIGDSRVGKTTFTKIIKNENSVSFYSTNTSASITTLPLQTNQGTIELSFWDPIVQFGVRDGFYIRASGAIIMFDLTDRVSCLTNVFRWHKDIIRVCGDKIPIVICGNKKDIQDRKVKERHLNRFYLKSLPYFEISSKTCLEVELPILWILKKIGKEDCCIIGKNEEIIDFDIKEFESENEKKRIKLLNDLEDEDF